MASSYRSVSRAITTERWAIHPDTLDRIVAMAHGVTYSPESIATVLARPLGNIGTDGRRGEVAIVSVAGPIFRYTNLTDMFCLTSIVSLAQDFRTDVNDPSVKSIVLEIDCKRPPQPSELPLRKAAC